jgi:hypothetical protein
LNNVPHGVLFLGYFTLVKNSRYFNAHRRFRQCLYAFLQFSLKLPILKP